MASTLSIENINLNGDILTASNGSLYINNNLIKNSSGIQITDRYFIKGYSPISFYSRWPQQGEYLNEVFLGDFFQATGILVTCSQPTTGNQNFFGTIYDRSALSAIDVTQFGGFELKPYEIYQLTPINHRVDNNKVIGLNIYNAPADMRSISINLLGYFSAAGKFDRMPKQVNFYAKNIPIYSSGVYEEYSQWDSRYTGFGIFCGNTGSDNLTFAEPVTGYISGILKEKPKYYTLNSIIGSPCNLCDKDINRSGFSGYFLGDKKINFPTKEYFSGFSGQPEFSDISGYQYSGFKALSNNTVVEGIYSGYDNIKYGGSGEIFQEIGWRTGIFPEIISGFLSGYVDPYGVFTRFSQITTGISGSGTFYRERFEPYNNLDTGFFKLDRSGYMIGYSGYFIGNEKYFFPSDRPISYNIVGFLSGYMGSDQNFTGLHLLNFNSGSSGYFINTLSDYVQVFFRTGQLFNDFIESYGIYTGNQYNSYYTGFSFPLGSGFSGIDGATSNTYGIMTGIIGAANIFIPFSGFSGRDIGENFGFLYSGMINDIENDFFSGQFFDGSGYTGQWISRIGTKNITSRQNITGFISVKTDFDFDILSNVPINTSGLSGYFIDGKIYQYESGGFDLVYNKFPEFNNNPSFPAKYGYSYSGFSNIINNSFSGIGYSGIKKDYIVGFISGFKNVFGEFTQFYTSGSSGFIIDNQKNFFPSGDMFSGFSGFDGFDNQIGFQYSGMGIYPFNGNNFTGDYFQNSGSGIVTGFIGWRNLIFFTKEYGTGIMTGYLGSRNTPYPGVLTGTFYHKDAAGNKQFGPKFGLKIGDRYQDSSNYQFGYSVPIGSRVGIDVYNPLSGISDINIVLFGYYE